MYKQKTAVAREKGPCSLTMLAQGLHIHQPRVITVQKQISLVINLLNEVQASERIHEYILRNT